MHPLGLQEAPRPQPAIIIESASQAAQIETPSTTAAIIDPADCKEAIHTDAREASYVDRFLMIIEGLLNLGDATQISIRIMELQEEENELVDQVLRDYQDLYRSLQLLLSHQKRQGLPCAFGHILNVLTTNATYQTLLRFVSGGQTPAFREHFDKEEIKRALNLFLHHGILDKEPIPSPYGSLSGTTTSYYLTGRNLVGDGIRYATEANSLSV